MLVVRNFHVIPLYALWSIWVWVWLVLGKHKQWMLR